MDKEIKWKEYLHFYWDTIKPFIPQQLLMFFTWIIGTTLGLISPYLTKVLIDNVLYNKDIDLLIKFVWINIGLFIFKMIVDTIQGIVSTKLNYGILYNLQYKLYDKIQRKDYLYFNKMKPGEIINIITSVSADVLNLFNSTFMGIIIQVYSFMATLVIMLSISKTFTIIALIPVPLIILNFKYFNKRFRKINLEIIKSQGEIVNSLNENINGMYSIKSFKSYDYSSNRYKRSITRFINKQIKALYIYLANNNIMSLIKFIPTIIFLIYGGKLVIKGDLTVGEMISFSSYMSMVYGPISALSGINTEFQKIIVSFKIYYDTYMGRDESLVINEKNVYIEDINKMKIDNIDFSFGNDKTILNKFSLEASKGDIIGIKGANGIGKSTIINLLTGLYTPDSGAIYYNDKPLEKINDEALVKNIGLVTQATFLFNDSIENNIIFGRNNIEKDPLLNIRDSIFMDFINSFDEGLNKKVIENGRNLSGGQQQKIGILRAIINIPSLILLDEPTSSLDKESKGLFVEYLREVYEDKIIIIVSHDKDLLSICNKIIDIGEKSCKA